jgi:hypothetical protein
MSVSWVFIQRGKAWACGAVLFLRPVLLVSPDLADPASVPLSLPCSSLLTLGDQTEPDETAAVIGDAEGVVRGRSWDGMAALASRRRRCSSADGGWQAARR